MSIIRGVNRRNSIEPSSRDQDSIPNRSIRPSHVPSQAQWEEMVQEMKSLMK
jgi:hypothetical protein